MRIAHEVADRSTCSRLSVGAIAVKGDRILATGYNGAPSGIAHCDHGVFPAMPNGCTRAVHAEVNVIATAAKFGVPLEGALIYVTHSPCVSCSGLLINAGISGVTYLTEYRDTSGLALLIDAGVKVTHQED